MYNQNTNDLLIAVFISGVCFGGILGSVFGMIVEDIFNVISNGRNKGTDNERRKE